MGKHFLATISNEGDHLFGVRFICLFFNRLLDHRVTLLHICSFDNTKNHAVVALGMGGKKHRKGSGWMTSTTTAKLISKLEKTSLWCCP